jgi:hypothetical protein
LGQISYTKVKGEGVKALYFLYDVAYLTRNLVAFYSQSLHSVYNARYFNEVEPFNDLRINKLP